MRTDTANTSTTEPNTSTNTPTCESSPWLASYPACVPHALDFPELPAWGLLERTAASHPNRIACQYYSQELSYAQVTDSARRLAATLVRLGLQPGERVGLMLPNIPEYLESLNGIWMAGGIAVAMSPLMVPEEVSDLMAATECRIVISLDLLAPLVTRGAYQPKHVIFATLKDRLPRWQQLGYAFAKVRRLGFWPPADSPNQHFYQDELRKSDGLFEPLVPQSLDEPAYILPTGGTTGEPKAVALSHRNIIANAWQIHHWAGARVGKESILAVLPFFHSYGLTTCLMTGTAMAATLIMHHRFIPRRVLQLIEKHQPSIFPAVPAMLAALNEILREKPIRFEALRYVISGGAPLSSAIAEEFAEFSGATVVEGFGLSEAGPVTHAGPLDLTNRPGTIGLPLPSTKARIVDIETGRYTLPPHQIGEVVVQGPQVMLGYWNNPEATQDVIKDGWLHTGDLGTYDNDGFFRIVDRKKDLIITSGFNVYPTDVEHVLRQYTGLADVAIIGVPDAKRGELVKAVVVPAANNEFDLVAFKRFAEEHLSKHKRPQIIEVADGDLPRNFLGKVQRRWLREQHDTTELAATTALAVAE